MRIGGVSPAGPRPYGGGDMPPPRQGGDLVYCAVVLGARWPPPLWGWGHVTSPHGGGDLFLRASRALARDCGASVCDPSESSSSCRCLSSAVARMDSQVYSVGGVGGSLGICDRAYEGGLELGGSGLVDVD
jgi:hypothetical protein